MSIKSFNLFALFSLMLIFLGCAPSKSIEMKKLVYVMDPQCGWCYGNSDNIAQVYNERDEHTSFELLVGGMWVGNDAPQGGPQFSEFIENHSPAMEARTGAVVSESFYALTKDSTYSFSSLEASAAIVAVKDLAPEKVFSFAKEVQSAQFIHAKRFDSLSTYTPILERLAIDALQFESIWLSEENLLKTRDEFIRASQLANGFPTLLMQEGDSLRVVASGYFEPKQLRLK